MNETRRREISTVITEIAQAERALREQGIDIADQDEWQQLRDITNRILAKMTAKEPAA